MHTSGTVSPTFERQFFHGSALGMVLMLTLAASVPTGQAAGEDSLAPFLKQYCLECHGLNNRDKNVVLYALDEKTFQASKANIWKTVFDRIVSGEMPPSDAKQPALEQRQQVLKRIKEMLRSVDEVVDESRWQHPSRGNWVDHDALFCKAKATDAGTRGRLWRLTGKGYEAFIQTLNHKYRLGFKTYGHSRVRAPWSLTSNDGFRDFASDHRIGEPEIEHHLRNATRVAKALISRIPKLREPEAVPLKSLLTSGKSATDKQIQEAADAAFVVIFARAPDAKEQQQYTGFLRANLKSLGPEKATEQLLIAILFHPEVMYRLELHIGIKARELMPPRELARSISYALTDGDPDEELLKATTEGRLVNREQIRKQVDRILQNREIDKPRILRFFQEYFGYTKAVGVFKDAPTRKKAGLRGKNDWHPDFFVSDTDLLIQSILDQDKNVLHELLTTNKTFALTGDSKQANGRKKRPLKPFSGFEQTALNIYEIKFEPKDWSEERAYAMPQSHRMGILTHPSWLVAHSTNFDNHAIHRGRWIRERLLGGKIPEIPVTVDAQLPDEPEHPLRHRMRVTREEYCWRCHQQMDPLGLPFEQFDHFGRFLAAETVVDKVATEKNVDSRGRFRGTIYTTAKLDTVGNVEDSGDPQLDGPVKDPFELIRALASSQRVQQVFVRHAFRYFMGRNETLADGPTLQAAHQAYVDGGGSMNALIGSLLTSDAFLFRVKSETNSNTKTPNDQNTERRINTD